MIQNTNLTNKCVLTLTFLLLLTGCAAKIQKADLLSDQGSDDVKTAVIDVRTKGEFDRGHIPGAVHIPVLSLPFKMDQVPVSSRDQKVVVYCAHGPRAGIAGFFLRLGGFSNVYHLDEDFAGWQKDNYPINISSGQ